MKPKKLVFFLEEPSAEALLQVLLPRILPPQASQFSCHVFSGKSDLNKQIEKKLRCYQVANNEELKFIVLRDQDSGDCKKIKNALAKKAQQAGKNASSLIRIACRELESWYLADLEAVGKALNLSSISKQQNNRKYRDPDNKLECPSKELERLTAGQYQKIAGSRLIGEHLDLDNNRSPSFRNFVTGIIRLSR